MDGGRRRRHGNWLAQADMHERGEEEEEEGTVEFEFTGQCRQIGMSQWANRVLTLTNSSERNVCEYGRDKLKCGLF